MALCLKHAISVSFLQLIFVGFILYFLYHVINKIRKQKRKYFKQFWNILELCTVIMAVLTCAMYAANALLPELTRRLPVLIPMISTPGAPAVSGHCHVRR